VGVGVLVEVGVVVGVAVRVDVGVDVGGGSSASQLLSRGAIADAPRVMAANFNISRLDNLSPAEMLAEDMTSETSFCSNLSFFDLRSLFFIDSSTDVSCDQ